MGKTLTVELPDALYDAVKASAEASGIPMSDWVVTSLGQLMPPREEQKPAGDIPEGIYKILQEIAPQMGKTTEEVAAEWLERYGKKPPVQLSEEQKREAWERLRRHIGAANLGYPTGADNESIDADLAREYGSTHDEEAP